MPEAWEICFNGFDSEEEAMDFADQALVMWQGRGLAAIVYPALDNDPETR